MKIIYKGNCENRGISNMYLKQLWKDTDIDGATPNFHHHRGFEVHIIEKGHQLYKTVDKEYRTEAGNMLVIPPCTVHCAVSRSRDTKKHSITFSVDEGSIFEGVAKDMSEPFMLKTPSVISENIKFIGEESRNHLMFSSELIQNRMAEMVIHIMRACGFAEENTGEISSAGDERLSMAKQYIKDNIGFKPTVEEVAAYCCISTKQLSRIFEAQGMTTSLYIRTQKAEYAERLLSDTLLSLREISEKLSFSSEYHFNSFFKKYAGVTPGEYRKMIKNGL